VKRRPLALLAGTLACAAHPTAPDPPADAEGPDLGCLQWLEEHRLSFVPVDIAEVRTPIEVRGAIQSLVLVPRAGRPARMDCSLARALVEAAPIFEELGVRALYFSGAYDHRYRRDSPRLSQHARGLAIDVHAVATADGDLEVSRDFEAGVGAWRTLVAGEGSLEACVGQPRTPRGRTLRTLACRLKLHSAFRAIATPDDNADHRDHLHLETFPDTLARIRRIVGLLPARPPN
jgi:hypothetical protein